MKQARTTLPPLWGTAGNDSLTARWDGDRVYGLSGNDRLSSLFNHTALYGGDGNDRLVAIVPTAQPEETSRDREVKLSGGNGDDSITVLRAYDDSNGISPTPRTVYHHAIDGGSGNDRISLRTSCYTGGDTFDSTINGGDGNDVIAVGINAPGLPSDIWSCHPVTLITGGSGNDHITAYVRGGTDPVGGSITTTISGGGGDDVINADTLFETLDEATMRVSIDGGAGHDVIRSTIQAIGCETIDHLVAGGLGNDQITMTTLYSPYADYNDTPVTSQTTAQGGAEADGITITIGFITSLSSGQALRYGGGNVLADGGDGNDSIGVTLGAGGKTMLLGGLGDDALTLTRNGPDSLERPIDTTPSDVLRGGRGNDALTLTETGALAERAVLYGELGNDKLMAQSRTGVFLDGGYGNDDVTASSGADVIRSHWNTRTEQDTLRGFDKAADVLVFEGLADRGKTGLADDLDAIARFEDGGVGGTVVVHFDAGASITFVGAGTGSVNSFADLVADAGKQIIGDWPV